jgi:hypothetical protein
MLPIYVDNSILPRVEITECFTDLGKLIFPMEVPGPSLELQGPLYVKTNSNYQKKLW